MVWFVVLFIVLLVIRSYLPRLWCALTHPVSCVVNGYRDLRSYIVRHYFDLLPTGDFDIYCGYFGRGKTLSVVHHVVQLYHRFNGKVVWDARQRKMVTQRVLILSNVSLSVPYEPLTSLAQVVAASKVNQQYDDAHETLTITLVLLDELSVQMNSRSFKSNIDAYFLNTLLCCRHYHISFFGTSQRFGHCDKLLRDVTHRVVQCDKIWRFQLLRYYDAWELENAQNPEMIKPIAVKCWFVKDSDYAAYDTLAVVDNLTKKVNEGDIISESEILLNQAPMSNGNLDVSSALSVKGKRRLKHRK